MATAKPDSTNVSIGYLQPGTQFEGVLTFDGTLKIGGTFRGEIRSEGTLIVDEGGLVEGEIYVGELVLRGTVEGTVRAAKRVSMLSPGNFRGAVSSPNLKIEEGVSFEGTSSTQQDAML
ncbi:MAG: polymer-forming cytoskeletal protein [Bdellovibrionaceae bacterium]|nr:polymer-forming cytoskeletal protein [Pseudobdellovibrionaceae bacterium]